MASRGPRTKAQLEWFADAVKRDGGVIEIQQAASAALVSFASEILDGAACGYDVPY
jgi:hypothetical protein